MTQFHIQQLDISNFRAVTDTVTINFDDLSPGLYFVAGNNQVEPRLGANGSGKSTIFPEALLWCFYGITSRTNRPSSDVENWLAQDSSDRRTWVTCKFLVRGESHTLTRGRKPSRLLLDGDPVEQAVIDKLLPLNSSALRRSLIIDQFSRLFLSLRPEEKSQIFSDTLNLQLWVDAADRAADQLKAVEREVVASDRQIATYTATIAEIDAQLAELQRQSAEFAEQQREQLRALADERTALAETVEVCRVVVDEAMAKRLAMAGPSASLDQKRAEVQELTRRLGMASATTEAATADGRRLARQLAAYDADARCPECGQSVSQEHVAEKRAVVEAQIAERDAKVKALSEQIENLPKEIEARQAEVAVLTDAQRGFTEADAAMTLAEARLSHAEQTLQRHDRRIEEVTNQPDAAGARIVTISQRLTTMQKALTGETAKHNGLVKQAEIYKFWQRGFKELRLELIDATLIEMELATNRHAEALGLTGWSIRFQTERETLKGGIAHAFNVSLTPPGQSEPISWESYSGGESQRWQLATTFALSDVLLTRSGVDADVEILDEPTAHLSPEGIEDLLLCLRERALEYGRKVLIIDHHALDRGAFDGVFMVTKSPEGVSVNRSH